MALVVSSVDGCSDHTVDHENDFLLHAVVRNLSCEPPSTYVIAGRQGCCQDHELLIPISVFPIALNVLLFVPIGILALIDFVLLIVRLLFDFRLNVSDSRRRHTPYGVTGLEIDLPQPCQGGLRTYRFPFPYHRPRMLNSYGPSHHINVWVWSVKSFIYIMSEAYQIHILDTAKSHTSHLCFRTCH